MADLDALKQKYAPVIAMIERFVPYGATLEAVDLAGEQLHIKGSVPLHGGRRPRLGLDQEGRPHLF